MQLAALLRALVVPKIGQIGLCTEDSGEEVAQDRSSMICGHSAVPDANLHHMDSGHQEFT